LAGILVALSTSLADEDRLRNLGRLFGLHVSRELWIESLGMAAVLPPPEETKQVKAAIGAAKAEQSRTLELEKNVG
jgi:hypothetical protein